MAFEQYKNLWTSFRISKPPMLAIYKDGAIRINKAAVMQWSLAGYSYVALWFDPAAQSIGVEFVERESTATFKVLAQPSGVYFRALSFLRDKGIKYAAKISSPLQEIEWQGHRLLTAKLPDYVMGGDSK